MSPGFPRWMKELQACPSHQLSPVHPCHILENQIFLPVGSQNLGITHCFSCFFGSLHLCIPAPHCTLSVFHRHWSLFLVVLPLTFSSLSHGPPFLKFSGCVLCLLTISAPSQCLRKSQVSVFQQQSWPHLVCWCEQSVCVCALECAHWLLMSWQVCFKTVILILREPK